MRRTFRFPRNLLPRPCQGFLAVKTSIALCSVVFVSVISACSSLDAREPSTESVSSNRQSIPELSETEDGLSISDSEIKADRSRYLEYIEQSEARRPMSVVPKAALSGSINIRATPNITSGNVVGTMTHGDVLDFVSDHSDVWTQIRTEDGNLAYVSSALTSTRRTGKLELHFIDVGQGDATLVLCPNGRSMLIDAGTTSGGDSEVVRDYLFERLGPDDPRLDVLVITHADWDHYSMLPYVLDGVHLGQIFHVGAMKHYSDHELYQGESFRDWLGARKEKTNTYAADYFDPVGESNREIDCGEAETYVLAANVRSRFSWKNTRSIVLMIRYKEFEVILTGDATFSTEEVIMDRYSKDWLAVDVLKIGHHGSSATSTSPDWAEATRPSLAIASAAWKSEHGHPRKEVIERLATYTIRWEPHRINFSTGRKGDYKWHFDRNYQEAVFSTATNGNIVVTTNGEEFDVTWFDYGE